MLVNVKDGEGANVTVIMPSQETLVDLSGAIVATGVSQEAAPANPARSGYFFQNRSDAPMTLDEMGGDASGAQAIVVPPWGTFPPSCYPVTVTAVNVAGTAAQEYVLREW